MTDLIAFKVEVATAAAPPVEPPTEPTGCDDPLLEVWPPPDQAYLLRIRGYAVEHAFGDSDDSTTLVDARLVFLLALANAKAHYGRPDAGNYVQQLETMLMNLGAGAHNGRRYLPQARPLRGGVYVEPRPLEPFEP